MTIRALQLDVDGTAQFIAPERLDDLEFRYTDKGVAVHVYPQCCRLNVPATWLLQETDLGLVYGPVVLTSITPEGDFESITPEAVCVLRRALSKPLLASQ